MTLKVMISLGFPLILQYLLKLYKYSEAVDRLIREEGIEQDKEE